MTNCANCKQKITRTFLMSLLDLTPSELADELHISRGHVSNILAGRRDGEELNYYLFCQIFHKDTFNN